MGTSSKEFFWTLPLSLFVQAARGVGYVDLPADPDAIYRRAFPLQAVDNGLLYPHLGVLAAALKLGVPPREIRLAGPSEIALGERRRIPVSEQGATLIDFAGPPPSARSPSMFPATPTARSSNWPRDTPGTARR